MDTRISDEQLSRLMEELRDTGKLTDLEFINMVCSLAEAIEVW